MRPTRRFAWLAALVVGVLLAAGFVALFPMPQRHLRLVGHGGFALKEGVDTPHAPNEEGGDTPHAPNEEGVETQGRGAGGNGTSSPPGGEDNETARGDVVSGNGSRPHGVGQNRSVDHQAAADDGPANGGPANATAAGVGANTTPADEGDGANATVGQGGTDRRKGQNDAADVSDSDTGVDSNRGADRQPNQRDQALGPPVPGANRTAVVAVKDIFVYEDACDCTWAHDHPAACVNHGDPDPAPCFKACCTPHAKRKCNDDRGECSCDCSWADQHSCTVDDGHCCWDCCCGPVTGVFRTQGRAPERCFTTDKPERYWDSNSSLWCFAVMVPFTYEGKLLQTLFDRRASIFDCDDHVIYSSQELTLEVGLTTVVVNTSLKCEYGGEFHTALNTPIFLKVWEAVIADGSYRKFAWTVKVDPDAVFFAWRLRVLLQSQEETPKGVYLNNCKYGLHGPIEVFSRNAVGTWWDGHLECRDTFRQLCSGDCPWGEDLFIDQCLSGILKVDRVNSSFLLMEDHCDPPEGWRSCDDPRRVAFHPFKLMDDYVECLENAAKVCPAPTSTTVTTTTKTRTTTSMNDIVMVAQGFVCDVDLVMKWGAQETEYCCETYGLGCPGGVAPPEHSAGAKCGEPCADFDDPQGTCSSRIRATARRDLPSNPHACEDAYALTVAVCPDCQACTAQASGCSPGEEPPAPPPEVPPTAEDCEEGYANWQWEWSQDKMRWCCAHVGRGCAPTEEFFDCDADFLEWEGAWSAQKKSWCCQQFRRGCQIFDCEEDFEDWARGWSLDKRAWCCQHESRGCMEVHTQ